jgi:hypothetical protein
MLPDQLERELKEAETAYNSKRIKVDRGTATESEYASYVEARKKYFAVCESILKEMFDAYNTPTEKVG